MKGNIEWQSVHNSRTNIKKSKPFVEDIFFPYYYYYHSFGCMTFHFLNLNASLLIWDHTADCTLNLISFLFSISLSGRSALDKLSDN